MKLRNGQDEPLAVVNAAMMALRDLKEDHGQGGLLAARRIAMNRRKDKATVAMLTEYGLYSAAHRAMPVSVQNVVLSAVTARGELISPVAP